MTVICHTFSALAFNALFGLKISVGVFAKSANNFFGIELCLEIQLIVDKIERKTGEEIYVEFIRQEDYQLGSSFISVFAV